MRKSEPLSAPQHQEQSMASIAHLFVYLAFFLVGVVFLLKVFSGRVILVPARKVAVVERLGQFSRVIKPGWHLMSPLVESIRTFRWSYTGQDGKPVNVVEYFVSTETNTMDVPPIECISRDNAMVTIDGRVSYKIVNLEQAAYNTDDILNLLYTYAVQATKQIVSQNSMQSLLGHDVTIGQSIAAAVNARLGVSGSDAKPRGIVCEDFAIQSIDFDEEVLKKNQEIGAQTRQHELTRQRAAAEHETVMEQLEMARAKAAAEQSAAYKAKQAELELQKLEAIAESERRAAAWRVMLGAGFSVDQIIRLENVNSIRQVNAKCKTRLVVVPHDFIDKMSPTAIAGLLGGDGGGSSGGAKQRIATHDSAAAVAGSD